MRKSVRSIRLSLTSLCSAIAIPLSPATLWYQEEFSKVPAHKVTHKESEIQIEVRKSASPLIHALSQPILIKSFLIEGEFKSLPTLPLQKRQGEKGSDDFALRIGFIVPGEKRLSNLQRLFAPDWVIRLYEKVPRGAGLDRVQFFNLVQDPAILGQKRRHPLSELIHEEFVSLVTQDGVFIFEHELLNPLKASALWISSDGDDTQSTYQVVIRKIQLTLYKTQESALNRE